MPVDFTGIKTTKNRKYSPQKIAELNDSLSYLPLRQRAYVLGSIIEESGGDPLARSENGTYQGYLQWGDDRYRISSNDPEEEKRRQLELIRNTLDNTTDQKSWTHGGTGSGYDLGIDAYNDYKSQDVPLEQGYRGFSFGYVRPEGKEESYQNRLKVVRQVYDRLKEDENNRRFSFLKNVELKQPVEQPDALRVDRLEPYTPIPRTPKPMHPIKENFWREWGQMPYKAEGGQLNQARQWNNLSMAEKSEMMKVAVKNGITTLPEIRDAYNEFACGGNLYSGKESHSSQMNQGYIPSKSIRDRITQYEGKAMTGAVDPLSGRYSKNNSFESEARGFYNALPEDIRNQILSNPELADNLYSYSYNVGAGNFKKRVVPALINYYRGNGTVDDIEKSMWASGDSKLRGLQIRRAEEKAGVRRALSGEFYYPTNTEEQFYTASVFTPSNPQAFFAPLSSYERPVIEQTEGPIVDEALARYSQAALDAEERRDNLNKLNFLLSMTSPTQESNPMLDTIGMLSGNINATGGHIYSGIEEPTQQMQTYFAGELPEVTAMPEKYNTIGFDRIIERKDPYGMTMYYYNNPDTGQEEMLKELGNGKYMTMDERSIFDVPKAEAIRAEQAKGTQMILIR